MPMRVQRVPALGLGLAAWAILVACESLSGLSGGSPSPGPTQEAGPDAGIEAGAAGDGDAAPPCDASAVAADPLNCGSCGHSCLGGACNSGTCGAVQVAAGQGSVSWIAVDTSSVYWTNGTSVLACAKSGCGQPTVIASGLANVGELVAGGSHVFWGECDPSSDAGKSGLFGCPSTGCQGAPALLSDPECVSGVGLDVANGEVYFGYYSLYRCPTGGCAGSPSQLAAVGYTSSIVVQSSIVYYAVSQGHLLDGGEATGGLGRCTSAYCSPTGGELVARAPYLSVSTPSFVGSYAYWAATNFHSPSQAFAPGIVSTAFSGQVVRANIEEPTGGPAEIIVDAGAPTFAVASPSGLYYDDFAAGTISLCSALDCASGAVVVAQGQGKPFAMTQDDAAIYWGNWGDGRIMKLAK
jgi:hypothetical protein